ncbi:hypothetical protein [Acinetobacter silvestris]|uniref:Uncharacterized protein n=1 Tax=Acinetobacter silvestris TaxID=1977882 RepID=A0A1Y3CJK4_9GAMM|nr:hypothetical protein [Acinetobacter silvestris]OTG67299.1 hypothetical protein B9T28_01320 [Acinetobacter silvestris]
MALDQIWKQQLTLVTYGNEYLTQNLSFNHWVQHSIFNQHSLLFRDLLSQHLLAQHFQIWLEGLKKQGVDKISLHSSSVLNDEQNPNANVELLPITHFIVSHEKTKKTAWIFGKELAEWYTADNDYEIPTEQCSNIRNETFWRFELNPKLIKRIDQDLAQPNWDDIQVYTNNELFDTQYAQGFTEPANIDLPYDGRIFTQLNDVEEAPLKNNFLSLFPTDYPATYAHETLHRLDALSNFIQAKIQQPYHPDGVIFTPDEQLNLRHFAQKLDDLTAKFVVKVANHYKSARLTQKEITSPFDNITTESRQAFRPKPNHSDHKVGKFSVLTLIVITVIICICAYYFGL